MDLSNWFGCHLLKSFPRTPTRVVGFASNIFVRCFFPTNTFSSNISVCHEVRSTCWAWVSQTTRKHLHGFVFEPSSLHILWDWISSTSSSSSHARWWTIGKFCLFAPTTRFGLQPWDHGGSIGPLVARELSAGRVTKKWRERTNWTWFTRDSWWLTPGNVFAIWGSNLGASQKLQEHACIHACVYFSTAFIQCTWLKSRKKGNSERADVTIKRTPFEGSVKHLITLKKQRYHISSCHWNRCSEHTARNCWLWMTWDSSWSALPNSLMRKGFHWTCWGLVIAHAISSGLGWVLSRSILTLHLYSFLRTLWLGCGSLCTIMGCGKPAKFIDAIVQRLRAKFRLQNLTEVSAVFWPCAACYGVLIPCFLFYLYTRQHVMLRNSRMPLELQSLVQSGCPTFVKTGETWNLSLFLWHMLIFWRIVLYGWTLERWNPALRNVKVGKMRSWFKIPKNYASDSSPLSASSLTSTLVRSSIHCALYGEIGRQHHATHMLKSGNCSQNDGQKIEFSNLDLPT